MNKIIALFFSLWLPLSSVMAESADKSKNVAKLPIPATKFKTCSDLLSRVQNGAVEKYFADGATTELQALSLMRDYGAVIGADADKALLATLEKHGLIPKDKSSRKAFAVGKKASKMTNAQWVLFADDYFEQLKVITAASTKGSEFLDRVIHLQLSRFAEAVKNSKRAPLFAASIKAWALQTLLNSSYSQVEKNEKAFTGEGFRGFLMFAFAFGGGILGAVIYSDLMPKAPDIWWIEASKFVGGAVSFMAGACAGFFTSIPDSVRRMLIANKLEKYQEVNNASEICKYIPLNDPDEGRERSSASRAFDLARALSLSEKNVDWRRLDQLSPMQITYVGQIDLLMAQADALAIENALAAFDVNSDWVVELKRTAQAVVDDSESYFNAAQFLQAVQSYTDAIATRQSNINELITSFENRVESMKRDFLALKKMPFQLADGGKDGDMVDRGDLLMRVVQSELMTIEKAKVERKALQESMAVVNDHIVDLNKIVAQRKNIEETRDVRQYAEETLLLIERMQALQTETAAQSEASAGGGAK